MLFLYKTVFIKIVAIDKQNCKYMIEEEGGYSCGKNGSAPPAAEINTRYLFHKKRMVCNLSEFVYSPRKTKNPFN
ncbi:hypothetical protein D9X91_00720 [Falsibacillus albus]|uniref:Uncharacterized protein n=1 Tax=Falsibacillus albus TaxID=2478915 RepID=A0A3L7K4J6_9BACI|nr:hypothetical protein D9X91_00720 [Falsibacillus albus]